MAALRVVAKLNSPFIIKTKDGNYEGFLVDVWNEIAEELRLDFTFEEASSSRSVLEVMSATNASIGLSDFSVNYYESQESAKDVEFSPPYLVTGFGAAVYLEENGVSKSITLLASTFHWRVWLSIVAMFLINSTAFFFYTKANRNFLRNSSSFVDENYGFVESLWFSAGTWLRQGTDHRPKTLPLRIVATGWYLFCLVFVSIYTAKLASTLTAQSIRYPLRHVADLPIQTSVQYGTKGIILKNFFADLKTESAVKNLWPMMERWNTTRFKSWSELENHAKRNRGKFAMIRKRTYLESLAASEPYCDLFVLGGTMNYDYLGFAMHSGLNTELRRGIRHKVLNMARTGILQALQAQHWQTQTCSAVKAHARVKDGESLGVEYFIGVFVVVVVFYVVSIVAFVVQVACVGKKTEDGA